MTDKEKTALALQAAKLFTLKPWKHKTECEVNGDICYEKCVRCSEHAKPVVYVDKDDNEINQDIYWENTAAFEKTDCTIPDPVDVEDWNVAKKIAGEVNCISKGMVEVYNKRHNRGLRWGIEIERLTACSWFSAPLCQPKHLILAACNAREGE